MAFHLLNQNGLHLMSGTQLILFLNYKRKMIFIIIFWSTCISSLYLNIDDDDGMEAGKKTFEKHIDEHIPSNFLCRFPCFVLEINTMMFGKKVFPPNQRMCNVDTYGC